MTNLKKESNIELIVRLRKELHNIPERSMHEVKTKQTLIHFIETHTQSLEIVDMDQWFYVVKKGKCDDHPIAFRADYDAVTCADGCPRHLCGHDGHSAVLAGFSLWLDTAQLERDVYLIFQPGEENGMGAAIAQGLSVHIFRVEEFPATINDKECVDKIWKIAHRLNQKVTYAEEPFRWSEDFGYYLQKTKGAFIGIGCGVDYPALHTMEYEFDDEIIESVIGIYKEISALNHMNNSIFF